MQIKRLHKNIYRLYAYSRTQECLDVYRRQDEGKVHKWQKLKQEGVCDKTVQEFSGLSKASYYRARKRLKDLDKGIPPPCKRPRKINKPHHEISLISQQLKEKEQLLDQAETRWLELSELVC